MLKEIIQFKNSKEWIEFEKYYNSTNLMEQIDLFRYEDANTNFLKSLLNENNPYNLGNYPLRLLIELIACKNSNYFQELNTFNNLEIKDINAKPQQQISKKLRPDMLIQFKTDTQEYLIVIEAKLFADEREDQCKDYREYIEKMEKYQKFKKVYLFLSLDSNTKISDEEHFIKITYQDLIDYIYTPCILKNDNMENLDNYLKCFTSLYENDNVNFECIPITKTGKDLTYNVWKSYSKFIIELIEQINSNNTQAQNFYNANKSILRILIINIYNHIMIDKNTKEILKKYIIKSTIKYKIDNGKPYGKAEFVYHLLKLLIEKHNYQNFMDIPEEIRNCLNNDWKISIPEEALETVSHSYSYRLCKKGEEPLQLGNGKRLLYAWFVNEDDVQSLIDATCLVYPNYKKIISKTSNDTLKKTS